MNMNKFCGLALTFLLISLYAAARVTDNKYLPPNYAGLANEAGPPAHFVKTAQRWPHQHQYQYQYLLGRSRTHAGKGVGSGHYYHHNNNNIAKHTPILQQSYHNDAKGNYNFSFETGNGIRRNEIGQFKGAWPHGSQSVSGSYSYTGDDGHTYTVNYRADGNGFQATGDHLPTPPTVPLEIH